MAVASYLCRIGGFLLMRYVTITPRTQVWLKAIPIALVGAILGPVAANGGPAEWLGLATAVLVMRWSRNEFAALMAAVVAVAAVRAAA
jgi:uncharacterized membrane protein